MDVFLMIRRKKTTIFTEAKESSTVLELKHIIESILKRPPEEQQLFKDDQLLDDRKTLGECGFTSLVAKPQTPARVGLAFRMEDAFEGLHFHPYSCPQKLKDLMENSGNQAKEQVVQ
ncbi:elongin-B-like isoform X2 [Mastomys coucha]|uniref:elongin-B-like isoform X2 n=1 Tax=Mastomys coucha TaxID=35658 RepID=UPI0012626DBA|nr:elongin-B-like isoform X2 [Mastomys coucha]